MRQPPSTRQFGPTQKDVALSLRLSQSTVARALGSQPHKLPEATVAKIQAKALELGYRPQRMARILRKGRSYTIGVVFVSSPYHAPQERVTYLARQAIEAGYQLVAADLNWFGDNEADVQDYLLGAAVEGVIFSSGDLRELPRWEQLLTERRIPAIHINPLTDIAATSRFNVVRADIGSAFEEMTKHHLAQGSRRLTLLSHFRDADYVGSSGVSLVRRVRGFCRAILDAGGCVSTQDPRAAAMLDVRSRRKKGNGIVGEIVYPIRSEAHTSAFELGRVETEKMILEGTLAESLICTNDAIAAGAISACMQHGISVPAQVAISGADDAQFAPYCGVPLTSIRQNAQEITRWAIERVVHLIENPSTPHRSRERTFPCELVVRQSTSRLSNQTITR